MLPIENRWVFFSPIFRPPFPSFSTILCIFDRHPSTAYDSILPPSQKEWKNIDFPWFFNRFLSDEWSLQASGFYTIINPKARKFCINIHHITNRRDHFE